MSTTNKFLVKVIRPVIEEAVVEVEAADYQAALVAAAEMAIDLDDAEWSSTWESDDYSVHPVAAYEKSDDDEEFDALGIETHRYALLEADLNAGQGRMLLEPWMESSSGLMIADLTSDWSDEVEGLREEGVAGFLKDLRAEVGANNVISFAKAQARRRARHDERDD